MKRILQTILCGVLALFMLTGCGGNPQPQASSQKKKLKVVATIFPEYDWVKAIMGEQFKQADVTLLLNKGTDIHSYQPTVQDLMKVADADVFIYVGGESDFWVDKALGEARNKNMQVVNLLEVLGSRVKTEKTVEGMQIKHGAHDHDEAPEEDEHVWLSLRNAQIICKAITEALCAADKEHAQEYTRNNAAYEKQLSDLDKRYTGQLAATGQKTILFGDRFPFVYLAEDYGLKYYAAFVGCSAETEASFQTITFLAGKIDELKLKAIFTLEHSDGKIAATIAQAVKSKNKPKVLALDSMQATGTKEINAGATYLNIMEKNLTALKDAVK